MSIAKPCSYHYLFSHIPIYKSKHAQKIAQEFASSLIQALQLHQNKTEYFQKPRFDVTPLSLLTNDETQTSLLQFLSHDVLTTVLTLNQTEMQEDPLSYWKRTLTLNFPDLEDLIGQTTVLFAQAEPHVATVQEIANACFDVRLNKEIVPFCQFEWGSLYFLPAGVMHFGKFGVPQSESDTYVLLIPETEDLEKGCQFLTFSFPMLESIRQILIYEEEQARRLRSGHKKCEVVIKKLLDEIISELTGENPDLEYIQNQLLQVDDWQVKLYYSITETRNLLRTLKSHIISFELYLATLLIQDDHLFKSLSGRFRLIYEQISADVEYAVSDVSDLGHQWKNLRRKLITLRQKADQQKFASSDRRSTFVSARQVNAVMMGGDRYQPFFPDDRKRIPSLYEIIEACHNKNVFPQNIYHSMNHIRALSNLGIHPKKLVKQQAQEILNVLATVIEWYNN